MKAYCALPQVQTESLQLGSQGATGEHLIQQRCDQVIHAGKLVLAELQMGPAFAQQQLLHRQAVCSLGRASSHNHTMNHDRSRCRLNNV